jgi:hypothetical protein
MAKGGGVGTEGGREEAFARGTACRSTGPPSRRPAAQRQAPRQAPRARASPSSAATSTASPRVAHHRNNSVVAHVAADSLSPPASPPPSLTPPPPQWTGRTAECRRPRTAACGGGRRGRVGGQRGRGRVCLGLLGGGARAVGSGAGARGAPLPGSRQWAAWRGQMRQARAERAAGAGGWRQERGGGRGLAHVGCGCRWMCVCEYWMCVWASGSNGSLVTATGPLSVFVVRLG